MNDSIQITRKHNIKPNKSTILNQDSKNLIKM